MQFRVLGELQAGDETSTVSIRGVRQQSLLVVLLIEANRCVTGEQLIERVWGTSRRPDRPVNALQTQLTLLRRALAPMSDVSIDWQSPAGYRLTVADSTVDMHMFRRFTEQARKAGPGRRVELLEQALALWRGQPFESLDTPWLAVVRATLVRERLAAQLALVDLKLHAGKHVDLLPGLADLVDEHPMNEQLAGQFMLALYRSGRASEALDHFHQIRQRLNQQLGTDPTPALGELHQSILTNDQALRLPADAVTPSAPLIPRQLPAAPSSFVGRDDELATISAIVDEQTSPGQVAICLLAGAGGIGKTWLALQWAHQNQHRFPDGQLFVDLHGFSPQQFPLSAQAAVRALLQTFNVKDIPADLPAQTALLRSLLAGKRMLILLDNAADSDQVVPLLPGATCTVLVTSRVHLTGLITEHGARHLSLDVLTATEARAVMVARLGLERLKAEPEAMADLVAYCAGLPLALSLVASRALTNPRLPLTLIAQEFRESSDLDVVAWSYRALTGQQAEVFCLLGIAPGPDISLAAANSLVGRPAATVLRGLEEVSLLTRGADGRYQMHDLVRRYAADQAQQDLTDEQREAALRRVVDFYLHTAYTGARQLGHQPYAIITIGAAAANCEPLPLADLTSAREWFEAEHIGVQAAHRTAIEHGWHDVVWQIAWCLHLFHFRRGNSHEVVAIWKAAATAADLLADPMAQAVAHRYLGRAYAYVNQYAEAAGHLGRSLATARHAGLRDQQVFTLAALGWCWGSRGDDAQALNHFRQALDLADVDAYPQLQAEILNSIGWHNALLGNYDEAHGQCAAALIVSRQYSFTANEARTLDSLGYIAHQTGRHAEAVRYYQRSNVLNNKQGNVFIAAGGWENLGHPYVALGQHELARQSWQEALRLYQAQHRADDARRVEQLLRDLTVS